MAESSRKRRRLDPVEICQQVYDVIRNHKKEDGTLLCDSFIRAPKRRQEPAYYDVVSNPIDLLRIQQKIRTDEYDDLDQMTVDFELLVKNAKTFYPEDSSGHRDACKLWEIYRQTADKAMDNDQDNFEGKGKIFLKVGRTAKKAPTPVASVESDDAESEESRDTFNSSMSRPVSMTDEENHLEELFSAIMNATNADGRLLHTAFQLLPSRKAYPDYYQVIENPIDLKLIATKIQNNEYNSLNDLEKDLNLMTKNACSYNEPGSQIYKDAKMLKKIIATRKSEIEHTKQSVGKTSERIRSKRARATQSLSAITAALQYEDSMEGMSDYIKVDPDLSLKDEMDDDDDTRSGVQIRPDDADSSPYWQLFETVQNFTDNQGNLLSDPFLKLPSRRRYSDYYREIKNPISLEQIRVKVVREDYGTVAELASDLNLMFENAKHYNRPDSKLFKDAVKLQKLCQAKVQELLVEEDSSEGGEIEFTPKRPKGRPRIHPLPLKNTPKTAADGILKKRLRSLYRCLMDFIMDDGRQPILVFMEKPSKKLYPDYYRVIAEPIDMVTIDSNIKNDRYSCEEELLDDLRLMFNNCRQYNEEASVIYEDANTLERVLFEKARELGLGSAVSSKNKRRGRGPNLTQKLKSLYDAIREFRDPKGRQLAGIFMKLPSKMEYPDYYEVIKKPIDLEKIGQKVKATHYENLEELLSDIVLMFDNACRYNEPDSQIYKDALTLQRVALQTKIQLCEDEGWVPDVRAAVQELLTSLFAAVYNHQDEEGRCYSDSLAELPEHDESDGKKIRAISLDLIKRRLDKGLYKRLDGFQDDIFLCFERARRLSRTDSQVFEDSVELQSHFIKQRDELCRHGDVLSSPALAYSMKELTAAVDSLRLEKLQKEQPDDDLESKESGAPASASAISGSELSFNQETYHVGDFVYIEATERNMDNHVYIIERLWTGADGQQMLFGNWFCRPNETFHLASRKFLEQEVFKSDVRSAHPLSHIRGRCFVLNVKEYFKMKPDGFADRDVYVCESRYSTKARMFKKIKIWTTVATPGVTLAARDVTLEPKRVVSVFRERIEKHKEELAELGEVEKLADKNGLNVETSPPPVPPADGLGGNGAQVYYQQLNIPGHNLRTGDCVYVRAENGKQLIAQIDSMWVNSDGVAYFHGPWYVTPTEIAHAPNRLFYKQEVFLSSIEDTNPLLSVVGKCCVLDYNDYVTCRPTEVIENDTYVCESLYEESRRQIKKLPREGLKKFIHSANVLQDEIYFFRRPIQPQRNEPLGGMHKPSSNLAFYERESSPLLSKITTADELTEDSMDGPPPSVGSDSCPPSITTPMQTAVQTPTTAKKPIKIFSKRMVTGYIIYSGEVRKGIAAKNPEATFGEVSRMVGNDWRNLPAHVKADYEERAQRLNEETAAEMARTGTDTTAGSHAELVYECCWQKCDFQFDDINDLTDHLLQEPNGHVLTTVNPNDPDFQCSWRGCGRIRKGVPPFPKLERLLRHMREVHIQKNQGKAVAPSALSKNYHGTRKITRPVPVTDNTSVTQPSTLNNSSLMNASNTNASVSGGPMAVSAPRQTGGEPIFVAVPPKPQRLLHSEAYIKYIEGLHNQSRCITNWDKSMRAKMENTFIPDVTRLPSHWIQSPVGPQVRGNGTGNRTDNVVSALWMLREHLMASALNVSNVSH